MNLKRKICYIGLGALIDFVVILIVVLTNNGSTSVNEQAYNRATANMRVQQVIPNTDEKIIQSEEVTEDKEETIENEVEVKEETESKSETITEENKINESFENVIVLVDNDDTQTEAVEEIIDEESLQMVYDEMSIDEKEAALYAGTLHLEYSGLYTYSSDRLTVSKGALYFNGHKETYYSEKVLPGTGLNIPGRHVADDGTIRDEDGYICVAANQEYMAKGSILITSLGPAKVYDTGCAYGTIDIYVNW